MEKITGRKYHYVTDKTTLWHAENISEKITLGHGKKYREKITVIE